MPSGAVGLIDKPKVSAKTGYVEATCDRAVIVKAAQNAIKQTRQMYNVDTVVVRRLMKIARTESKFLIGGWIDAECGCLVGNAFEKVQLPEQEDYPDDVLGYVMRHNAILSVGTEFDQQLRDAVFEAGYNRAHVDHLVVVDA